MSQGARLLASRNTLRVTVLVFAVSALRIPIDTSHYGFWPLGALGLAHALGAGVLALWLWRRGERWSVWASDLAYVAVMLPHLLTFWLTQVYDHSTGALVEPLLPHHSLQLAIALLPPSSLRWASVLIGAVTAHAIALWAMLAMAAPTSALGREPWFTLIIAGIAMGLVWSRRRRRTLELRLAVVEARADAVERLNRVLLALRDRANTPLQTLEVAIALLEQQPPSDDPLRRSALAAMRRALGQLVAAQQPVSSAAVPARASQLAVDLELELHALQEAPEPSAPRDTRGPRP